MKKICTVLILMVLFVLPNIVLADIVNMNISVNGTSNLNITVDADDTLARQMIARTQEDIYGTMTGSGPKDMLLDEISRGYGNPITTTENMTEINQICSDPYLQGWLRQLSTLPPLDFVDYLKAMGYDDEAHANFIWTICQQKYIEQNEARWNQDLVGGGIQQGDLVSIFSDVVSWLTTGNLGVYSRTMDLALILESYFASDSDVWILSNKIRHLELRVEALERTIEATSSEEYCNAKLDMMKAYNMTSVKCGVNSTVYWNAGKDGFDGYETIAYKDCTEDWICIDWSPCADGTQTRKCVDKNACGSFLYKPKEKRECAVSLLQSVESVSVNPLGSGSRLEIYEAAGLSLESMLPVLVVLFISVEISLLFVGLKSQPKKRKK